MDIEYEIVREGYELFGNDPPCEVFVPWTPYHNKEYPLVLEGPEEDDSWWRSKEYEEYLANDPQYDCW